MCVYTPSQRELEIALIQRSKKGRSTANNPLNLSFDCLKFVMTGHSDR